MKRLYLALVLLLGAGSWSCHSRAYQGYSGSIIVTIEPGASSYQISKLMEERGAVESRWSLWVRYALNRSAKFKAGEYSFDRPMTPAEVYTKLVRGDIVLYTLTVPEGSDRFDTAAIVARSLGIDEATFLRATENGAAIHDLDPKAETLEGYLFPETYRFPRNTTAQQVVARMLGQFRRVLQKHLTPGQPMTPDQLREVITLASLVEKETPSPDERPLVAGVFKRRLKLGMPLQCDPTVIYAARLRGRATGPIKLSDLNYDSPYNTYRHPGLPPGPIASPGEASIRAALQPADTDMLYFVSNDQGGHLFSRTLAEHNVKVARYRQEVAARRRAERAASQAASNPKPPKTQHVPAK